MCPIIKTHPGCKGTAAHIIIRTIEGKFSVGAIIEKTILTKTRGILDGLAQLSMNNPKKMFEELVENLAKKYDVKIEIEGMVTKKKNIKNFEEKQVKIVYLIITSA